MATWADYQLREFEEVEVVYSSLTYLYDAAMVIKFSKYEMYAQCCYSAGC